MYTTLNQTNRNRRPKRPPEGVEPTVIRWQGEGQPATIEFSDRNVALGSCIRCYNPPCMEYSDDELELTIFPGFPADRNTSVCPTHAISLPLEAEAPVIDQTACIQCGVCLSRCPVRAIYFTASGAQINDLPNQ